MKKVIYIASFFLAPALTFLLGLATKMQIYGGCVDACDIAVFVVSIVFGKWVGLSCCVGVALSDIACSAYVNAIFSGVISALVGWLCGYVYKHTFASFSVRARKILSLLCAFCLYSILWFGATFILVSDFSVGIMLFLLKIAISLICGLLAYFVLPKNANIFDKES